MRALQSMVALVALTIISGVARADESEVPIAEVPKAGLDAVKKMFPEAKITGAAKETEEDETVYEVTLKQGKRTIDVTIGVDGKIQLVEKEIDAKELPAAVKKTLETKYPNATFKIIEQVDKMKDGKLTLDFFEALLVDANKETLEVQIAPDGKIKKTEKKKSEKD